MENRFLGFVGIFSLSAFIIAAGLAKAAVVNPLPPHQSGPGVTQRPCLCMHLSVNYTDKAFVEEAMHAAVIPVTAQAIPIEPLPAATDRRLDLIAHAKKSVNIAVNDPSRELMQALIHAQERHVRVYLFTDDAGWEHARMLVYRGGSVSVVEFPKPVLVADDRIVDVDGKVVKNDKLAEDYLIDFVGLAIKSIGEASAVRW